MLCDFKIDQCDKATDADAVININIVTAVRWAALVSLNVTIDTILKCFQKAGLLDKYLDVI